MSVTSALVMDEQKLSPIDDIETFVLTTNWQYDRVSANEMVVQIKGHYCEYQVTISWMSFHEALHIAFAFSVGLSKEKMAMKQEYSLLKLLSLLNEHMQIGHFDLWRDEHAIVWRYGQFITQDNLSLDNLSRLFRTAVDTCERFYPSFQFVLWAGHSPLEALQFVLLETAGEA